MHSHPEDPLLPVKKEPNEFTSSSFAPHQDSTVQSPVEISSSEEDDSPQTGDTYERCVADASKQMVLYDPAANGTSEIGILPQPIQCQPLPLKRRPGFLMPSRVLPSVGAFTVQCAACFKWRFIPTKEKYEEIREHILEQPFYCETARQWRPDISCDDPADITQDGSRLWAIDKPNIVQPPRGWQRLLRIRGEGSSKFADVAPVYAAMEVEHSSLQVDNKRRLLNKHNTKEGPITLHCPHYSCNFKYYQAPSGKMLRSMVEIERFLMANPEYVQEGATLSQFSFQIPRPLQENYVRKRPRLAASCDNTRPLEPSEVNPLSWVPPDDFTDLQLGRSAFPPPTSLRGPNF